MFAHTIAIDRSLYEKLRARADAVGYSQVDELIRHVLEREIGQISGVAERADVEKAKQRLRGLGYIS